MSVVEALRYAQVVAFAALALVSLRLWRRQRTEASMWLVATFASIAAVSIVGAFLPQPPDQPPQWASKALLAVLLLFPYLLFRFMEALVSAPRWARRAAIVLTAVVIGWTFVLPPFGPAGGQQPVPVRLYVFGLLIQWASLSFYVTVRLWRAGRGQPGVVKRRMRILGTASAGLALALIVSGIAAAPPSAPIRIVTSLMSLSAAGLFLIGFAPPKTLRVAWRIPETEQMREGISHLMVADTVDRVAEILVPGATRLVGGEAAALIGSDGEVIAFHSDARRVDREALVASARADGDDPRVLRTNLRNGQLVVWASPFTPFFGGEEMNLLRSMAALADMALERVSLSAQERRFIADASHEMRTPLTAISGLADTLASRHRDMPPEMVEEILVALNRQGERARSLIENLLDLSRLGRGGSAPSRERVRVAEAVRSALEAAPPPSSASVEVSVDDVDDVMANLGAIEQILVNLLSNAYNHGGNAVSVAARRENGRVTIEVRDDGPGIAADMLPTLFDPFTRGRDPLVAGSGLGLAISQRLARSYGGDLTYMNAEPRGSRFLLRLEPA